VLHVSVTGHMGNNCKKVRLVLSREQLKMFCLENTVEFTGVSEKNWLAEVLQHDCMLLND